ncbi:MAG: hypothetical protein H7333_05515 [Bdellovibrionales bacterium]|nr:hypothetical protein [Oligoflexia bacterium]
MCAKTAKLRATLSLFLATFGMYSVSLEAFSSPLKPQTVKYSRSAREVSNLPRSSDPTTSRGPFSPATHNLSLGIGQVFLLGSLSNRFENSIGPEINYTYGVSDLFAFESNFGYHSHSNGSLSIWNMAAGLRTNLMFFDQLVPFFNVGLGFYHPSFATLNGGSLSGLLFGLQLGTGIDLLISNQVFFGTRLTYNDMFDSAKKDSNGVNQSLGGSYVSFMVHAGLTF